MAFYFALFNVSNVNQQLRGQAHKRERRRHSLATSSHVAKDYRLLPRPKIIFHDTNTNTDNETVSTLLDETEDETSSGQNSFKYLNTPHKDSLKYRRASSPEHRRHAMDIAFNEPFSIAEIERHLKRVKFSSPAARSSNENEAGASNNVKENQEEEQVWVKRTLSPSKANHVLREDPWVYSIDLESRKLNERSNRPPLPERQRPTMGVSALELRTGSVERNRLRDDLRRHVNTWPEIRANRARWRPTLLLRRHSGGNLNENDRLTSMFQKRRGSGDNKTQIPYQSITPTSPPQDPTPNEPQPSSSTQKLYKQLPPKPQKSIVVITPTNRQSRQNTVGQFRTNLNSWAQNAIYRGRNNETNVPFVRLNNDGGRDMIRSSVF